MLVSVSSFLHSFMDAELLEIVYNIDKKITFSVCIT